MVADTLLPLLVSAVISAVIGWNREHLHMPAGLRTHMLVAIGSTLITLVSVRAFPDDPARIAANIVVGIGFLGAGTIFKEKDHVRGLTTAASIWAVSGIGIATGVGFYLEALIAAGLILLVLQLNIIEDTKAGKGSRR